MIDREKVISEFSECIRRGGWTHCGNCEYKKAQGLLTCEPLAEEILALLKEQDAVDWTKCTDRTPDKDGEYLVVKSIMGMFNKIDVCAFSLNLHEIDEFDFPDEKRPGWYEHDSETGYFEWTGITHWAELPKMPDGIVEGR